VVNGDVEMRVGMRRITPIPVMSFAVGAKSGFEHQKAEYFPDGKARGRRGGIHPRAFSLHGEWRGEREAGGSTVVGALIKINPGHSYFHKLSARGLSARAEVAGALKADAFSSPAAPK